MIRSQSFKVMPEGIIQGGLLDLRIDTTNGQITTHGSVTAKKFFFTKTISLDGAYQLDPKLLASEGKATGQVMNFGLFSLTIQRIDGALARCSVELKGDNPMKGTALVDLGAETIAIQKLDVYGSVMGFDIHLLVMEC